MTLNTDNPPEVDRTFPYRYQPNTSIIRFYETINLRMKLSKFSFTGSIILEYPEFNVSTKARPECGKHNWIIFLNGGSYPRC